MTTRDHKQSAALWPLIVLGGQLVSAQRAERNYLSLPEILPSERPEPPAGDSWPGVSVIVPARNEEANLPRLLDSLVVQEYPLYEIIVVDDASTDATPDIIRRYARYGVRMLHTDGPPAGWTGKNHACWLGARASNHPWLLLVDADTELSTLALRSSLRFALEKSARALSLFARQRCETFWERLLLPFAYQQYFVGVHARQIHDRHGPALANGQYFLINREAYEQAGGHAANAHSIIDDVSLAYRLKQLGIVPQACRGEALVTVRMYSSLSAIINGFGKNSYLFLRKSPLTGIQTAISTALAASIIPLFLDAWRKRLVRVAVLALLAYCVQVIGIRSWVRRFDSAPWYALLAPFSALSFLAIALNSMLRGASLPWKGRRYQRKRVRYRLPRKWIMEMGRAILTKTPRPIADDCTYAISTLPVPPRVMGVEHIPRDGSFVLVSNHYQRLDLWIGWSGALLIDAVSRQRSIAFHYITTDRARIGRFTVPGTRWLIERVAAVWDLLLVTPPAIVDEHLNGQRYALLRMLRLLQGSKDQPVCIGLMPEGDEGTASGLIDAVPGSGRALQALSARGVPIVPAAVWEHDGQLHAQFGAPFSLEPTREVVQRGEVDAWAREQVMQQIAFLLPVTLRGRFGRLLDGSLG